MFLIERGSIFHNAPSSSASGAGVSRTHAFTATAGVAMLTVLVVTVSFTTAPVVERAQWWALIDRAHRLMHLWRAGEEARVNDYIDDNGLACHALFARLLQALIELAPAGSEERALLESLSNHLAARAGLAASRQAALGLEAPA